MSNPLEDYYEDIVGKAQSGHSISDDLLAERAGVSRADAIAQRQGEFDEDVARKIAPVLDLDPDALVESGKSAWAPERHELKGLVQISSEWPPGGASAMIVNAYIAWVPGQRGAILFDTGTNSRAIVQTLESNNLELKAIFLTHSHQDHIAVLDQIRHEVAHVPAYIHAEETIPAGSPITEKDNFEIGSMQIEPRLTNGHSPGGTTFVLHGLQRPVAIVGDSLFAGSAGGAAGDWHTAIDNNLKKILTLPDDTLLCPGHGPMTTVAEEKRHNPLFAHKVK